MLDYCTCHCWPICNFFVVGDNISWVIIPCKAVHLDKKHLQLKIKDASKLSCQAKSDTKVTYLPHIMQVVSGRLWKLLAWSWFQITFVCVLSSWTMKQRLRWKETVRWQRHLTSWYPDIITCNTMWWCSF